MASSAKPVFICYAHADNQPPAPKGKWLDRLLRQLKPYCRQEDMAVFSDKDIQAGDAWHATIQHHLRQAKAAVVMVSPALLASDYVHNSEIPVLLKQREEAGLTLVPVIVSPCAFEDAQYNYPDPQGGSHQFTLGSLQAFASPDRTLTEMDEPEAERTLLAVARRLRDILKEPSNACVRTTATLTPHVDTHRLPATGSILVGRAGQFDQLDEAWSDPHMNVISLVAFGGVGKSALVNHWLAGMALEDYRGAKRVFGWSAYSQGTKERVTSAEVFVNEALAFFGFEGELPTSIEERARHLAKLVAAERNLLVLDGIEPLQHAPGPAGGFVKDGGLRTLLRMLSAQNAGLVVVSSRVQIEDLAHAESTTCPRIDLETLEPADGAELLGELRVDGSEAERAEASEEFGGHALALTLLGNWLAERYAGDVRRWREVGALTYKEVDGGHARRVMDSYETGLGEAEREVLRVIGLFDRPAEPGAIRALRHVSPVACDRFEVTDGSADSPVAGDGANVNEDAWQNALVRLRRAGLLLPAEPASPGMLDAHPLVREHFGHKHRKENPSGCRASHSLLFDYYRTDACPEHQPDTIEALSPLYAAVAHGCAAERYQEALDEVFWKRIQRGNELYSVKKLGAFGSDLAALSGFFDRPWREPTASLSEADRSWLLNQAGADLRALGRLAEAIEPFQAGLEADIAQEDWKNAAIAASNVSELQLTLGRIAEATGKAEEAVEYADLSGDAFQRMGLRTTLADAFHQAGRHADALSRFEEAEAMQKARQPEFPRLYSLPGYRYCDLLLTLGRHEEVLERATYALKIAERNHQLLSIGLDHVSLARALLGVHASGRAGGLAEARDHAQRAVDTLRQSGHQDDLPRGLLARAEVSLVSDDHASARVDLDEALTIARRDPAAPMKLHEAACEALLARLEEM